MNIFKRLNIIHIVIVLVFFSACSKDLHFSGISENTVEKISQNYLVKDYTKEEIKRILGSPIITEDLDNLWIYSLQKELGNAAFKKTLYNKTLKLKFDNNVLRSVEEVDLTK